MNYKFFGNSLDLLKYDILTVLGKYGYKLDYIPMLTKPEEKKEDPKYKLYEIGYKNIILSEFIQKANRECLDVEKIDLYFRELNIQYNSFFTKNDEINYFENSKREEYFNLILSKINDRNQNMIFIDPDVGIDIGISRRVRSNRNLYLKKEELDLTYEHINKNSFLCFFQHLGNYRINIENRKKHLKEIYGDYVLIIAYERLLFSIIFIFKEQKEYNEIKDYLNEYIQNYKEITHFDKLKLI